MLAQKRLCVSLHLRDLGFMLLQLSSSLCLHSTSLDLPGFNYAAHVFVRIHESVDIR